MDNASAVCAAEAAVEYLRELAAEPTGPRGAPARAALRQMTER